MSPVFKSLQKRWKIAHDSAQSRLLQLSLLRELAIHIHFKKSSSLATGCQDDARLLEQLELQVIACRNLKKFPPSLLELLEKESLAVSPASKTELPRPLFKWISREKWDRFDRRWESAIAAEALRASWRIWSIEASVAIRSVEKWDQSLRKKLWPKAIVLFMEFAGTQKNQWVGRWYVAARPEIKSLGRMLGARKKMKLSRIYE